MPMGSAPFTAVFTHEALIAITRHGMSNWIVRIVSVFTSTSGSEDRMPVL